MAEGVEFWTITLPLASARLYASWAAFCAADTLPLVALSPPCRFTIDWLWLDSFPSASVTALFRVETASAEAEAERLPTAI